MDAFSLPNPVPLTRFTPEFAATVVQACEMADGTVLVLDRDGVLGEIHGNGQALAESLLAELEQAPLSPRKELVR